MGSPHIKCSPEGVHREPGESGLRSGTFTPGPKSPPPERLAVAKPTLPDGLWTRAEKLIEENPELGYGSASELTRDLLRRWCEAHEHGGVHWLPQGSPED